MKKYIFVLVALLLITFLFFREYLEMVFYVSILLLILRLVDYIGVFCANNSQKVRTYDEYYLFKTRSQFWCNIAFVIIILLLFGLVRLYESGVIPEYLAVIATGTCVLVLMAFVFISSFYQEMAK